MSRYRCDCGDTECPSCGAAQGTYSPPDIGDPPELCEACGLPRDPEEDGGTLYLCASCVKEARRIIRINEPRA